MSYRIEITGHRVLAPDVNRTESEQAFADEVRSLVASLEGVEYARIEQGMIGTVDLLADPNAPAEGFQPDDEQPAPESALSDPGDEGNAGNAPNAEVVTSEVGGGGGEASLAPIGVEGQPGSEGVEGAPPSEQPPA